MGKTLTIVGWGLTGKAGSKGDKFDNKFRVATNIVTSNNRGVIEYKFNSPSNGALDTEGGIMSGDSGGPAFIDGKIVGVASRGNCCDYGNTDQFKRLQNSFDWIQDTVKNDGGGTIAGKTGLFPDSCDQLGVYLEWESAKITKVAFGLATSLIIFNFLF